MWQVLFYVTPITVGIALVILGVSAVVVARWNRRSPRLFPREARWLLGTAAAMYLLILGGPLLGWDKVGTTGWGITWNPLSAYEELRQRTLLQRAPTWHWDLARKKPFTTGTRTIP